MRIKRISGRHIQRTGKSPRPLAFPSRHGLGDWVETWAKPIARWIDARVLPTPALIRSGRPVRRARPPSDPALAWLVALFVTARLVTLPLAGCSACSKRRKLLNQLLPDICSRSAWHRLPGRLWVMALKPAR